jgi:hypothetical protein
MVEYAKKETTDKEIRITKRKPVRIFFDLVM